MHNIKAIRERLELTQTALAEGMGCTQGNVWHYEQGQTLPSDAATRLIAFAKTRGLDISYDHVYGAVALPSADGAAPLSTGSEQRKQRDPNKLSQRAGEHEILLAAKEGRVTVKPRA